MYCMTYSVSNAFSASSNILILVNNSKSTSVFLILLQACHTNPGAEKNEQDEAHIFQYTCF